MKTLLPITTLSIAPALAQSYMTSNTLDSNDDLWADLTLYPGGGNSCPGFQATSYFGGTWAYGVAPANMQQVIQNAPDNSSWDWSITFSIYEPNAYGNGCGGSSWTSASGSPRPIMGGQSRRPRTAWVSMNVSMAVWPVLPVRRPAPRTTPMRLSWASVVLALAAAGSGHSTSWLMDRVGLVF